MQTHKLCPSPRFKQSTRYIDGLRHALANVPPMDSHPNYRRGYEAGTRVRNAQQLEIDYRKGF